MVLPRLVESEFGAVQFRPERPKVDCRFVPLLSVVVTDGYDHTELPKKLSLVGLKTLRSRQKSSEDSRFPGRSHCPHWDPHCGRSIDGRRAAEAPVEVELRRTGDGWPLRVSLWSPSVWGSLRTPQSSQRRRNATP